MDDGGKRMRGVVAQYHRADKSATATRDPAPSPAGCGSDFPKLSAQLSTDSVYCLLILQQAHRKPLLIYLQGAFRHRGINCERKRMRSMEKTKRIESKRIENTRKEENHKQDTTTLKIYPIDSFSEKCFFPQSLEACALSSQCVICWSVCWGPLLVVPSRMRSSR